MQIPDFFKESYLSPMITLSPLLDIDVLYIAIVLSTPYCFTSSLLYSLICLMPVRT